METLTTVHEQGGSTPLLHNGIHWCAAPTAGLLMYVAGRNGCSILLVKRITWETTLAACHLMSLAQSWMTGRCFQMLEELVSLSVWYRDLEKLYLCLG